MNIPYFILNNTLANVIKIVWYLDSLTVQVIAGSFYPEDLNETAPESDTGIRIVKLQKKKDGGLGLSIKVYWFSLLSYLSLSFLINYTYK